MVAGAFEPEETADFASEEGFLNDRPGNVNSDGEFIFRISGYEGFPALYARRVSSRSAKVNRGSTC